MRLRNVTALHLVFAMVAVSSCASVRAEDAPPGTGFVHSSVEELTIPGDQKAGLQEAETAEDAGASEAMCLIIETVAKANGLPLELFARVIWQESRFRSDAVGP